MNAAPANILIVDDDPSAIQMLARALAGLGPIRFSTSGAEALRLAAANPPDLILLDAEMPGMSGFQVCETLKADEAMRDVPVIFVTSHHESAFEVAGFEIGAADFIGKPVNPALMLARVKAQLRFKRLADDVRRIATIDALCGIANRRRFDAVLAAEWRRGRRSGEPLALLLIDVDHFKLYNDRYGHPAGDACLRAVARALAASSLRPADLAARYGGEEFVMLLPQTTRDGAEHVAHRVLDAVEALAIPHDASASAQHVTVSIGIGHYDEHSALWEAPSPESRFDTGGGAGFGVVELVGAADAALYAAKQHGRAQVWRLDIGDADAPLLAREVGAEHRGRPGTRLAAVAR